MSQLMWSMPGTKPPNLAEALARYRERTGRAPSRIYVHPSQAGRYAGLGLTVVPDKHVLRGAFCLDLFEEE